MLIWNSPPSMFEWNNPGEFPPLTPAALSVSSQGFLYLMSEHWPSSGTSPGPLFLPACIFFLEESHSVLLPGGITFCGSECIYGLSHRSPHSGFFPEASWRRVYSSAYSNPPPARLTGIPHLGCKQNSGQSSTQSSVLPRASAHQ